jgi:hypothetical protein
MKMAAQHRLDLMRRKKNMETLARLGITIEDAKERVLALTPADALCVPCEGDEPHERKCEFGIQVNGDDVWIRLIVEEIDGQFGSVVMSFHTPESTFTYLFPR